MTAEIQAIGSIGDEGVGAELKPGQKITYLVDASPVRTTDGDVLLSSPQEVPVLPDARSIIAVTSVIPDADGDVLPTTKGCYNTVVTSDGIAHHSASNFLGSMVSPLSEKGRSLGEIAQNMTDCVSRITAKAVNAELVPSCSDLGANL